MSQNISTASIGMIIRDTVALLSWREMVLILNENRSYYDRHGLVVSIYEFFPVAIQQTYDKYANDIYPMVVHRLKKDNKILHPLLESIVNDRVRNFVYNYQYQARIARDVLKEMDDDVSDDDLDRFESNYAD